MRDQLRRVLQHTNSTLGGINGSNVPQLGLGGTANLAVLCGNLPQSLERTGMFCSSRIVQQGRAGCPTQRAGGPFHPQPVSRPPGIWFML